MSKKQKIWVGAILIVVITVFIIATHQGHPPQQQELKTTVPGSTGPTQLRDSNGNPVVLK